MKDNMMPRKYTGSSALSFFFSLNIRSIFLSGSLEFLEKIRFRMTFII